MEDDEFGFMTTIKASRFLVVSLFSFFTCLFFYYYYHHRGSARISTTEAT